MVVVPRAALAEVGPADVEVPLGALVVGVVAGGAAEFVGAPLGHHVEDHAAGRHGGVAAPGRNLHLLEGVEVVVGGGGAEGRHVGDHHAVDRPDGLVAGGAGTGVGGLLAALVAADVDAVGQHSGRGREDRPGVARRGGLLEVGEGDGLLVAELARVEQRRAVRDHQHGLALDGRLETDLHVRVPADVDRDAFLLDRREPLKIHASGRRSRAKGRGSGTCPGHRSAGPGERRRRSA